MRAYAHIKKCFEVSDEDIVGAIEAREELLALLTRLSTIAEPNTGVAKVLVVFARMGSSACEWFDGALRVDVRADASDPNVCVIDVTAELGMGMRERIFPTLVYAVPIDEFKRAIERVPDRIKPLTLTAQTAKLLTFTVTEKARQTSMPPPPIKISEDSFFHASLKAAKTPTIDSSRAPHLPVVTPQLPIVDSRSSRKIRVVHASSKPPKKSTAPPPAKKSTAPPPAKKSTAPPPAKKSTAPPPKARSVPPPKARSVPPPKARSVPPPPASVSQNESSSPSKKSARPPPPAALARPALPRPKPRDQKAPEMPLLPIVTSAPKKKTSQPPKQAAKPSKPRLSLEARIGAIEDEDVDSGWEDD